MTLLRHIINKGLHDFGQANISGHDREIFCYMNKQYLKRTAGKSAFCYGVELLISRKL